MGMRIHRVLGYAADDVGAPEIDWHKLQETEELWDDSEEMTWQVREQWEADRFPLLQTLSDSPSPHLLQVKSIWDDKSAGLRIHSTQHIGYQDRTTICFQASYDPDWLHHDSSIDFALAIEYPDKYPNGMTWLKNNPYPYSNYVKKAGVEMTPAEEEAFLLFQKWGNNVYRDKVDHLIRPAIPSPVITRLLWLFENGAIDSVAAWKERLRPGVFQYWS